MTRSIDKLRSKLQGRKRQTAHPSPDNNNNHNDNNGPSMMRGCFWPSDLLARDRPDARIFTYGYDSSVSHFFFGAANRSTITDNGRNLLQAIASQRTHCQGRPLIFIAHSLGGLVVKAALMQASKAGADAEDHRDVLKCTIAIMFFGTPHSGSEWVDLGKVLRKFASAFLFSTDEYRLNLLSRDSEMLELLRDDFARLLHTGSFRVTSFQETVGFKNVRGFDQLIVDRASSSINHPVYERRIPLNANHVDMCKFGMVGESHREYEQNVKAEIERHVRRHQQELEKRCLQTLRCFYERLRVRADEIEEPYANTLAWMLRIRDGPGLYNWLAEEGGIFWIQGLPGSGKSTAMKWLSMSENISSTLQKSGWDVGRVFYTDRKSSVERSWKGVLASMLFQLLEKHSALLRIATKLQPPALRDTGSRSANLGSTESDPCSTNHMYDRNESWTVELLESCLMQCKNQTTYKFKMCFFIDALDENDGSQTSRERLLRFLNGMVTNPGDKGHGLFKIVAASRPENDIELNFQKWHRTLKMQEWTVKDIKNYVTTRLDTHSLRYEDYSSPSQNFRIKEIRDTVVKEARGVFIWVRIVMDQVTESMTDGVSLDEILEDLLRMPKPDRGLSEFFNKILSRVPLDIRLALLWETERHRQSSSLSGVQGFRIEEQRVSDILDSSIEWERRIRRASGGLLQLQRPPHRAYESYDGRGWSISQRNGELFAAADSLNEHHCVHPGSWSVQFLHQTVKEFFRDGGVLRKTFPAGHDVTSHTENGHSFILAMYHSWLLLPKKVRRQCGHERTFRPASDIPSYALLAESTLKRPLVALFMSLDRLMTEEEGRDDWLDADFGDETWKITFMAFAVAKNMKLFVQTAIAQFPHLLAKRGRPLLHFTAWAGGGGEPNTEMAKFLLDAGVQVNGVFEEEHCAKKALESIVYGRCDESGRDHVDYIKLLISRGAELPGTILHSDRWETVLHAVVGMPILWPAKFELICCFVSEGVSLNGKCSEGSTVFDTIVQEDLDVPREDYLWMLNHGGKITSEVLEKIYEEPFRPSRLGKSNSASGSRLVFVDHPLRHISCRERSFYDDKAARLAKRYNPHWPSNRHFPRLDLRRLPSGSGFLRVSVQFH